MNFERTLHPKDIPYFLGIASSNPNNCVYLKLGRCDQPNRTTAAVVVTPQGGYAQAGCVLYENPKTEERQWLVDPFLFFEQALDLEQTPRFDTTTRYGRRVLFSHIDGDGMQNTSWVPGYHLCIEAIHEAILKKVTIPITVSAIGVEVNPDLYGSEEVIDRAKEIFAMPHIEVGVHGFTHPLIWREGTTSFPLEGYAQPTDSEIAISSEKKKYKQVSQVTVSESTYLQKETVDAAQYLTDHLVPLDKPVTINQWSGDCKPPARAITFVRRASLRNINGGDSRMDRTYPSYTGIAPLVRQIGREIQVYATNANENIYTHEWTQPLHGFLFVIETFQQTEQPTVFSAPPRRISPINIHYHFYSGERVSSLQALKKVYEYALAQPTHPIFTTTYCDSVMGFLNATATPLQNGWAFDDYGACQTVRFDIPYHKPLVYPDLTRSEGILGFKQWNRSLYIHLDQGDHAELYFSSEAPKQPYLQEASVPVHNLVLSPTNIALYTEGFGGMRSTPTYSPRE